MRSLSKELQAKNLSLEQAITGVAVFDALAQLHIDPGEVQQLLQFLRKVSPVDFPIEQFVKTVQQMARLETETGLTFQELETKAASLVSDVENMEVRKKALKDEISSLEVAKEGARHALDGHLDRNKATIPLLEQYGKDRQTLLEARLSFADIKSFAEFIRRARSRGFWDSAQELATIRSRTGMDHAALVEEYKQKTVIVEESERKIRRLKEEEAGVRVEIERLKRIEAEQLAKNRLTENQVDQYLATQKQLANFGISFEHLESLVSVANQFQALGWQARTIIEYVARLDTLVKERDRVQGEVARLEDQLATARNRLHTILDQTAAANTELQRLQTLKTLAETDLARVKQQVEHYYLQIQFDRTLGLLLLDPATVKDPQIFSIAMRLFLIPKARENPGLPIDYGPLRREFEFLVETVLSKKLILKETMERETTALKNMNTDLQFDRLGKMENERNRLTKKEADLESREKKLQAMEAESDQASTEKTLSKMVSPEGKSLVRSRTCARCGSTHAFLLGSKVYCSSPIGCPFCYAI